MNEHEKKFYAEMLQKGYIPIRNGWPDFLVVPPGNERPFAVELKYGKDVLSEEQKAMHAALRKAGIDVRLHQVIPAIKQKTIAPTIRHTVKSNARRRKTWIDIIVAVLQHAGTRLTTREIERKIHAHYHQRLRGIAHPHGAIGSALARLRQGKDPRVRCARIRAGTFVYWAV